MPGWVQEAIDRSSLKVGHLLGMVSIAHTRLGNPMTRWGFRGIRPRLDRVGGWAIS